MSETVQPVVTPGARPEAKSRSAPDTGFLVVCWNDPVNLQSYVTHVFQQVFGWARAKAEQHMLEVHNRGRSVLARETLEKAEHYVHSLHKYTLHATLEKADS